MGAMPAIAFDLDLTLIDTRPGMHLALTALARETGREIDADGAIARLGIPMAEELAHWFPLEEIPEAVTRTRALFMERGIPFCTVFPEASTTLAALRDLGMTTHVVTSRHKDVADALLTTTGLIDQITGGVDSMMFGPQKVPALRRISPAAYVGDHPADMAAAEAAATTPIGVTTGNHDRGALREAGAVFVVPHLGRLIELVRDK